MEQKLELAVCLRNQFDFKPFGFCHDTRFVISKYHVIRFIIGSLHVCDDIAKDDGTYTHTLCSEDVHFMLKPVAIFTVQSLNGWSICMYVVYTCAYAFCLCIFNIFIF